MAKGNIMRYLGYALYAVAIFILVGMFYNTSRMGRTGNYYQDEVFPNYENYDKARPIKTGDESDELQYYMDGYVTVSNGFYDTNPIYSFKNEDPEVSKLLFELNIYRAQFSVETSSLYFFTKTTLVSGFVIEIKPFTYDGETNLMQIERGVNDAYIPKHQFKVNLEFNPAVLPNVQQTNNAYSYMVDPVFPAVINDNLLSLEDNRYADLVGISILYTPTNEAGELLDEDPTIVFTATTPNRQPSGDANTLVDQTLDLSRDQFVFDEIAGDFPTEAELSANPSIFYKPLELSQYNRGVVVTMLIVGGLVLLATYFMFIHKIVKAKISQARTEKRLADKKASEMQKQQTMEADFNQSEDSHPETNETIEADFEESDSNDN